MAGETRDAVQAKLEDVNADDPFASLVDIKLSLGRRPRLKLRERVVECSNAPLTSQEDIRAACAPLSFDGMQRAALPNELHRISRVAMADGTVTALVLRVGRTVRGASHRVADLIAAGKSILFLGAPGAGKSTRERWMRRRSAICLHARRDNRRASAGSLTRPWSWDGRRRRGAPVAAPGGALSRGGQVLTCGHGRGACADVRPVRKSTSASGRGLEVGGDGAGRLDAARARRRPRTRRLRNVRTFDFRTVTPAAMVVDELRDSDAAKAAAAVGNHGVQLIATAHAETLAELVNNKAMAPVLGDFEECTLSDRGGHAAVRGTKVGQLQQGPQSTDRRGDVRCRRRAAAAVM